jgi:PBSX family phage terminase large subunit
MLQSSSELDINLDYLAQPKQRTFHESEAKYRLYIGAWRAGKTYAGCVEALKKSIVFPGNCGVIGRKDFTDLRDTTLKTFLEVCPADFIQSYNKTEHHIKFVNGSEVYFRELKDGTGLGSLNLGWFYIDESEEIEEGIFERLKGRLSLKDVGKTQGWLTSNPPNENHWIFRPFELSHDVEYFTVHASTYENKEHLPTGYIEDLEKLPPSWRKKYLEGHYGFTPDGTPYFQGYQEYLHKRALAFEPSIPLHCGWDSGRRHPAFVATQWDGRYWKILAEILGSNVGIEQFVDTQVIPLLNTKFIGANCIHYGGPEYLQVNDKSDYTSNQILQSKGIRLHIKHSEYSLRKQIIEKKINSIIDGAPCLQVDNSCRIINDGFLGGYCGFGGSDREFAPAAE